MLSAEWFIGEITVRKDFKDVGVCILRQSETTTEISVFPSLPSAEVARKSSSYLR